MKEKLYYAIRIGAGILIGIGVFIMLMPDFTDDSIILIVCKIMALIAFPFGLVFARPILFPKTTQPPLSALEGKIFTIVRWGTIPATILFLVGLYDLAIAQPHYEEAATVISKRVSNYKGDDQFHISIKGLDGNVNEHQINHAFYNAAEPNDEVMIHETTPFHLWKSANITRNGKMIADIHHVDKEVPGLIALFMLPLLLLFENSINELAVKRSFILRRPFEKDGIQEVSTVSRSVILWGTLALEIYVAYLFFKLLIL